MKTLVVTKYVLAVAALVLIFFDWKIALGVFLLGSILHVIPLGPNTLLSVLSGYLLVGGAVCFFFDWRIGVALLAGGLLVTQFRLWGNKKNFDYYNGDIDAQAVVSKDIKDFIRNATSQELLDKEIFHYLEKDIEHLKMLAPYNRAAAAALEIKKNKDATR